MSAEWTNKYAIMRDLSWAQGCVPVDLESTVGAGDKPPLLDIVEETEENFYSNGTVEGDFAAPDLALIKRMINMVKELDVSSEENNSDVILKITKVNALAPKFIAKDVVMVNKEELSKKTEKPLTKHKEERNVAIASLLKAIHGKSTIKAGTVETYAKEVVIEPMKDNEIKGFTPKVQVESLRLMKPKDFELPNEVNGNEVRIMLDKEDEIDSTNKVNAWLESQVQKTDAAAKNFLLRDSCSMFKRKSSKPSTPLSSVCSPVQSKPDYAPKAEEYVPSTEAEKYYQKYLERSKLQTVSNEDIWTKTEKMMREVDEKLKSEEMKSPMCNIPPSEEDLYNEEQYPCLPSTDNDGYYSGLEGIYLSDHRHRLQTSCIVCEVLCEKKDNKSDACIVREESATEVV